MRNRTSDLPIPRSDALPLSHREFAVSEVYCEVHILLGSAMSIVSCCRIRKADPCSMHDAFYMNFAIDLAHRRVSVAQWGLRIFSLSHARDKKENIFL